MSHDRNSGTGRVPGMAARRIEISGYSGLIAAAFDDPAFLSALASPESLGSLPGAEVLSEGRNSIRRVPLPLSSGSSADIIVKEFGTRGVDRLKSLVLSSKAERAWRGAAALVDRRLGTAPPAACLTRRKGGFVDRSFFLAGRITGAAEVRGLFRDLPPGALESLLEALAAFLSKVHDRGILHRDLSDGNVLVKRSAGGGFEFFLLDTNRIRVRRRLGRLTRAKNLIRLGVPAAHREFFLARYFGARSSAFPRFWYRLNKAVFANYIALKRKLRLRRLARALRIQ